MEGDTSDLIAESAILLKLPPLRGSWHGVNRDGEGLI